MPNAETRREFMNVCKIFQAKTERKKGFTEDDERVALSCKKGEVSSVGIIFFCCYPSPFR